MGKLELIIGPMYSGKSTELIRLINRYRHINKKVLIINHAIDVRYGNKQISTHDKIVSDCVTVSKFSEIDLDNLLEYDVIVIDELQFFPDACSHILYWVKLDKYVICAGLSGDYEQKCFGDVYKLIPHADKIVHLKAFCSECNDGTKAAFTKRIGESTNQVEVGSLEMYKAVCHNHL